MVVRAGALVLVSACSFAHGTLPADGEPDAAIADDDDADADAAMRIDAAAQFDVTRCPTGYVAVGSAPGSRYRVITTTRNFWDHHGDCVDDGSAPELTHLVVLGSQAEADAIADLVDARFYVGATQDPGQTLKSANWRMFDGNLVAIAWAVQDSPSEPSDSDGVENGEEQIAIADADALLSDAGGLTSYRAICECDGVPIHASVTIPPRP